MATNWPPTTGNYPSWPPEELGVHTLTFGNLKLGINHLTKLGFTWRNATPQEVNANFRGVQCDEGHNVNVIFIVSPLGRLYPFAYCNSASHRSVLVPWIVGYDIDGQPVYDAGNGSGVWP